MKKLRKAFTFIELLIALTIFSIIAASIYYTLNAGIRTWSRGNSVIMDNQRLRIFFDTISRDLVNTIPNLGEDPNAIVESEWEDDKIAFPTIVNTFLNNRTATEIAKVVYEFDEGESKLIRRCATVTLGFDEEYAEEEILLEDLENFNIEDFGFEYCYMFLDEYDWRKNWEFADKIPRGIKIRLVLKNEDTGFERNFEKIVFMPTGEIGKEAE